MAKLARDPLCEDHLLDGVDVLATEVDHVDGNSRNCDPSNLRSLCGPCHRRKTIRCDGGFGRKGGA